MATKKFEEDCGRHAHVWIFKERPKGEADELWRDGELFSRPDNYDVALDTIKVNATGKIKAVKVT